MGTTLIRCTLLALAVAPTIAHAAAVGSDDAWWKTFRRPASGTSVAGVSIAAIDTTWRSARELSQADLKPEQRDDMKKYDWSFLVRGDFNADGRPDKAVVGTYTGRHGQQGRFVAVFTRQDDGQWSRAYREVIEGPAGFSALRLSSDTPSAPRLYWSTCMACAATDAISWTGTGYALVTYERRPAN